MLIQSIPFFAILLFLILNIMIKKKFFCISTLSLLYVTLSFGGAILIYLRPRTGDSFVDLEAMVFLAVCMSLLCIPALMFNDHISAPLLQPTTRDMEKLSKLLIPCVLPVSLFYLCRALPYLHLYLTSDMGREDFRDGLNFAAPSESAFAFITQFIACWDFVALFLLMYFILNDSNKNRKLLIFFLLICGLGLCFDSLKNAVRSAIYYRFCFLGVSFLILSRFVPKTQKRQACKAFCIIGGCLLVPFLLISIARFDTDFWYSIGSYISTGPYSFNTDYVAVTEYGIPTFCGYLSHGLINLFVDLIFGTTFHADGAKNLDLLIDNQSATLWTYYSISGAYSGEFKTVIGSLLLDHSALYSFCLSFFISILFTLLFLKYRHIQKLSVNLCAVIYFYILVNSPIGIVFHGKPGNLQLIYLILFVFILHCKENKQKTIAID